MCQCDTNDECVEGGIAEEGLRLCLSGGSDALLAEISFLQIDLAEGGEGEGGKEGKVVVIPYDDGVQGGTNTLAGGTSLHPDAVLSASADGSVAVLTFPLSEHFDGVCSLGRENELV